MDFKTICQRLAREAGVHREQTLPTTVVGQTGELRSVVEWAAQSWLDIQGSKLWSWMWERPTLVLTVANQSIITGAIPETRYDEDSAYLDDGSLQGRLLTFQPWQDYRHDQRTLNNDNNVTVWTVQPDNSVVFNAHVTANTNVVLERWGLPTALAADGDIPAMPDDLHMLIVWNALIKYANFDEANYQRDSAILEAGRLEAQLIKRCLPRMGLGEPMLME